MEPDFVVPRSKPSRLLATTFSSLHHRNFRLYFSGQLISNTGNWLTNIAITLLVLKITHSGLDVGILAACQYGPIFLISTWGGVIADRKDKRSILLVTQSLEMAESIGLAILAFLPRTPLLGLYILALGGGVILAFDNPLRRSFVSELVPEKDVPNAIVIYSTLVNITRIIGPLLAGLLIVTFGYGWCFTLDAGSYIAIIGCLLFMKTKELFLHPPAQKLKSQIRAVMHYVISQPILWITFLMLTIVGLLSYNFNVTLPLFVIDGLHKTNTTYTVLYASMSMSSIVTALVVAHKKLLWGLNTQLLGLLR